MSNPYADYRPWETEIDCTHQVETLPYYNPDYDDCDRCKHDAYCEGGCEFRVNHQGLTFERVDAE